MWSDVKLELQLHTPKWIIGQNQHFVYATDLFLLFIQQFAANLNVSFTRE